MKMFSRLLGYAILLAACLSGCNAMAAAAGGAGAAPAGGAGGAAFTWANIPTALEGLIPRPQPLTNLQNDAYATGLQQRVTDGVAALRAIIARLREQLGACTEQLRTAQAQVQAGADAQKQATDLTAQLKACNDDKARLTEELRVCQEQLERLKGLQQQLDACTRGREDLRTEAEQSRARIQDLEQQLAACQKELQAVRTQLEERTRERDECRGQLEQRARELTECQERLRGAEGLRAQLDACTQQNTAKDAQIADIQQRLRGAEQQSADSRNLIGLLVARVAEYQKAMEAMAGAVTGAVAAEAPAAPIAPPGAAPL